MINFHDEFDQVFDNIRLKVKLNINYFKEYHILYININNRTIMGLNQYFGKKLMTKYILKTKHLWLKTSRIR